MTKSFVPVCPSAILTLGSSSNLNSALALSGSFSIFNPTSCTNFRAQLVPPSSACQKPILDVLLAPKVCQSTIFVPLVLMRRYETVCVFFLSIFQVASWVRNCPSWVHYSQSPLLPCPTTYETTPKTFALVYSVNLLIDIPINLNPIPNHPHVFP